MTFDALRARATARPWGRDGWHVYTGAGMSKRDVTQSFMDADAAFIVLSVNSIEQVVAALRRLVRVGHDDTDLPLDEWEKAWAQAESALAALDGEKGAA